MEKTSIKNIVASVAGKTLSGRDNEEFLQEFRRKTENSVSFTDWNEFVTYARAQWEARQKTAQATDNE